MATLSTARDRIKNDLRISGSDYDNQIDDAIRSAINLYQGRPLWFLEKKDTLTLQSGDERVSLPSDFAAEAKRGIKLLVNSVYQWDQNGFNRHPWYELDSEYRAQVISGQPRHYAIFNGYIYVDTEADADYTVSITYYKKDASLPTGDNDTSVWMGEGEGYDAIRSRALAIFKDESLEYEAVEKDWQRAKGYLDALYTTNNYRVSGG